MLDLQFYAALSAYSCSATTTPPRESAGSRSPRPEVAPPSPWSPGTSGSATSAWVSTSRLEPKKPCSATQTRERPGLSAFALEDDPHRDPCRPTVASGCRHRAGMGTDSHVKTEEL